MDYEVVNKELSDAYFDDVKNSSIEKAYQLDSSLSGIFLPKATQSYCNSDRKIMIIGKETRSWNNSNCGVKNCRSVFNKDAIINSMDVHERHLLKPSGKSKFLQFYKEASKVNSLQKNSIIWSNLFCASSKRRTPTRSKHFDKVKELSKSILHSQIKILKPDVLFFVTGWTYDKHIKDFFPEYSESNVIEKKALWSFKINALDCIRTSHPQWSTGIPWRKKGIDLVF